MKAETTRRILRPYWLLIAGIAIAASLAMGVEVWLSNRPAYREAHQNCIAASRDVDLAVRPEVYRQCMLAKGFE